MKRMYSDEEIQAMIDKAVDKATKDMKKYVDEEIAKIKPSTPEE